MLKNLDFSKHHFLRVFEKIEPDKWGAFSRHFFFRGFLKNGGRPFFQKSEISKIASSSHSKNAHIKLNGFQWVFGGWGDPSFIFLMGWMGQKSKNGLSRAVYPPVVGCYVFRLPYTVSITLRAMPHLNTWLSNSGKRTCNTKAALQIRFP